MAGTRSTDEMKVVVPAQAALLILEVEHDHYRCISTILVYPRD